MRMAQAMIGGAAVYRGLVVAALNRVLEFEFQLGS